MAKPETNVNVLNAIREVASDNYRNLVPLATTSNLSEVGNPILEYQAVRNEFLELLVNKIARPIVESRMFKNPLAKFKRASSPLANDEEEIGVNPAKAQKFNAKSTDLLSQNIPDVKVAYHRVNRQERYMQTIQFAVLRQGFTSWGGFDNLVEIIVESLYNGNYIDEFNYTKSTIGAAAVSGDMPYKVVEFPEDETTAKAFVKAARATFNEFKFPSTTYNLWEVSGGSGDPYISWSKPNDIVLFLRADVSAEVDVEVLAKAFNLNYADFIGNVITVDNFGENSDDILAVMCDKRFPVILDKLNIIEDFRNGSNLSTNYWLHVWQTYSYSPLQNVCCFRSSAPVPPVPPVPVPTYTVVTFTGDGTEQSPYVPEYEPNVYYTKSGDNYTLLTAAEAPETWGTADTFYTLDDTAAKKSVTKTAAKKSTK